MIDMKNIVLLIGIIIILASCTEKNTEDYSDKISGVRIRYIVSVVDGAKNVGRSNIDISNAIVCVVVNDSIYETPVDSNGITVFNNLFAGNAYVKVKCEGYTTANLIIDLKAVLDSTNSIYDATNYRVASSIINIFPTQGENLAKISGNIYADLDLTDTDMENVTESLNVRANIAPEDLYKFAKHEASGKIISLSYEDMFISTSSTSGTYSMQLPAGAKPMNYIINADDFVYQQQINASDTERVVFSFNSDTLTVQASGSYIKDLYYNFFFIASIISSDIASKSYIGFQPHSSRAALSSIDIGQEFAIS